MVFRMLIKQKKGEMMNFRQAEKIFSLEVVEETFIVETVANFYHSLQEDFFKISTYRVNLINIYFSIFAFSFLQVEFQTC